MTTNNDHIEQIITDMMSDCGLSRAQAETELNLECFSDFYKSVHGARPRWMYEEFRAMTPEQQRAEFAALEAYCETPECKAQTLADEEYYRQREAEDAAERAAYFARLEAELDAQEEDRANYWTLSETVEQQKGWL